MQAFIAEVKTKSPFGYESSRSWDELFELALHFGDVISIHTDPRWGGSLDILEKARNKTHKLIMAKGIHSTDEEIEDCFKRGADISLVVGRVPKVHIGKCLIEPLTIDELIQLPSGVKAVWNARDLDTGLKKKDSFHDALSVWDGWICQASMIRGREDVIPEANAFIVGESLAEFCLNT